MFIKKKISILGSTGSVGVQTLDVIRSFRNQFEIIGLSAGKNLAILKEQIKEFRPQIVSVITEAAALELSQFVDECGLSLEIVWGESGLITTAITGKPDLVVVAVVGTASLLPTYYAIENGSTIGLACKEVLVAAGELIMNFARSKKVPILPIDSEHAALKQCLAGIRENPSEIQRLILTASGGPFWNWPREQFSKIQKKDALRHPKWEMGQKITIDSATFMNKGLEVIEAHHLFGVPFDKIDVVIHPQSLVHSMVEFTDSTILAQMSMPDMRFPIQYVLTYPQKLSNPWPKMDFSKSLNLEFHKPDTQKFPLLKLAYQAGEKGGNAPIVMNAANEVAVQLFLEDQLKFTDIYDMITRAMKHFSFEHLKTIEDIASFDKTVKAYLLQK